MNFMTAPFSKGNIVNQTGASYTVLPGDGLIRCDSTSNNITLTLPAATGSGREITVKSVAISNNSITITSSGSTFDGQSSMTFISDGYGERTLLDVATNIWNVTSRTFDGYGGDLVLSAKTNRGIRINPSSPVYGWKDLLGSIQARTTGAATIMPFAAYQSGIYQYQMDTVNREAHNEFHLPHDYLPGSDIYIHVHWSLAAAGGTGSATFTFDLMYAKGYNQAAFPAAVTTTVTQAASGTAYQHTFLFFKRTLSCRWDGSFLRLCVFWHAFFCSRRRLYLDFGLDSDEGRESTLVAFSRLRPKRTCDRADSPRGGHPCFTHASRCHRHART